MKNKIDYVLVILAIIVIITSIHVLRKPPVKTKEADVPIHHVKKALPAAARVMTPMKKNGWRVVYDDKNNHVGSVVFTSPHADDVTGYAGPTPLMIAIDDNGRIKEVMLLEHSETPGFISRIVKAGYLDKWDGKHWKEAVRLEADTVSGATMSSSAIRGSLRKRLSMIDPKAKVEASTRQVGFTWQDGVIIFVPLMGLYLCFGKSKHVKILRYVQMAVSIVFLGFFTSTMFSMAQITGWIVSGVPVAAGLLFFVAVAVAVPIITGRNVHCFFVCPFGLLQELVYKITPWEKKVDPKWNKRLRYVRYGVLVIIAAALLTGLKIDVNNLEPFSTFKFKAAGVFAIGIALASLVAGIFMNRPWCSYGCAAGAFLDTLKRPVSGKKKGKFCEEKVEKIDTGGKK